MLAFARTLASLAVPCVVPAMSVAWGACFASGCSAPAGDASASADAGFPDAPLTTMPSRSGAYDVAIRTAPQPPSRGDQRVELTLTVHATGAPATGLSLSIVPWMPAMGHGTSVTPSVTETAPGVYVATRVDWYMPGQWVLRTTITGPALAADDEAQAPPPGAAYAPPDASSTDASSTDASTDDASAVLTPPASAGPGGGEADAGTPAAYDAGAPSSDEPNDYVEPSFEIP